MSRAPTWHEVADILARRMVNHAFCEDHSYAQARSDCPFCEDREAYQQWVIKNAVGGR